MFFRKKPSKKVFLFDISDEKTIINLELYHTVDLMKDKIRFTFENHNHTVNFDDEQTAEETFRQIWDILKI